MMASATAAQWLVANGWIYPTDSSINVAIGQGGRSSRAGSSLEAQDASGRWIVVAPDLGFPAGKNKTILDRPVAVGARRRRARAAAPAAHEPRGLLGLAGASPRASAARR